MENLEYTDKPPTKMDNDRDRDRDACQPMKTLAQTIRHMRHKDKLRRRERPRGKDRPRLRRREDHKRQR